MVIDWLDYVLFLLIAMELLVGNYLSIDDYRMKSLIEMDYNPRLDQQQTRRDLERNGCFCLECSLPWVIQQVWALSNVDQQFSVWRWMHWEASIAVDWSDERWDDDWPSFRRLEAHDDTFDGSARRSVRDSTRNLHLNELSKHYHHVINSDLIEGRSEDDSAERGARRFTSIVENTPIDVRIRGWIERKSTETGQCFIERWKDEHGERERSMGDVRVFCRWSLPADWSIIIIIVRQIAAKMKDK